ncbi:MAG: MlaD family protein [Pseudomonadota bacterium]
MQRSFIEILLGALVILAAIGFALYAYNTKEKVSEDTYRLKATFANVDGLNEGADVRAGGVQIGSVVKQFIDPETYETIVIFSVLESLKIPSNSVASIGSTGLLGGKFLNIEIGNDTQTLLNPEDTLKETKNPISLEGLLSRAIFLIADDATK